MYISLLHIHGLIRGDNLELGRDADTGGQTLYVMELAQALARQPEVTRVDLITRRIVDASVDDDYALSCESITDKLSIIRLEAGPEGYIPKEQLWQYMDAFIDNAVDYFRQQNIFPDILHSHYADAGYVGSRLSRQLGIPLIHTGHSLGRVKRQRLMASGLTSDDIESRYQMKRRIEAEELTLATAERVITSTSQEINEQYSLYDYYQPEQMRVIPPGTNLNQFKPPQGNELTTSLFKDVTKSLVEPDRPIILALSRPDKRKNIVSLLRAYGQSNTLQSLANVVIIAGNRDDIEDLDEGAKEVFQELLMVIDYYDLYGKVSLPKHHRREQVPYFFRMTAASQGVFVNPALTEPFGLTLIEAAASGLPVIATEDGGPRDILVNCKNGLLIDPLVEDTIRKALIRLLTDNEYWQQCAKSGLRGVAKFYSWQAHARGYLSMVQPIIAQAKVLTHRAISGSHLHRQKAFVTDLDQSLLGNAQALERLISLLKQNRSTTKFVLATGRGFDSVLRMLKQNKIPEPDVLISSCGTEIYYAPSYVSDLAWSNHIDYHWQPQKIRKLLSGIKGLKLQERGEQSRFKLSFFYDPSIAPNIDELESVLHKNELEASLQISFGSYLDILPARASKGLALRYIADHWQIPLEKILVAGGSGADEDMMRGNTLSVVVANRHHEELSKLEQQQNIYFAKQPFAAGILEAIEHYQFFAAKD